MLISMATEFWPWLPGICFRGNPAFGMILIVSEATLHLEWFWLVLCVFKFPYPWVLTSWCDVVNSLIPVWNNVKKSKYFHWLLIVSCLFFILTIIIGLGSGLEPKMLLGIA